MPTDEELDKFVNEDLKKDINQEGTIDASVEEHLGQMGYLYDTVIKKLNTDKICFSCKNTINLEKGEKIQVAEHGNAEKGVCVFVALCKSCCDKIDGERNGKNK